MSRTGKITVYEGVGKTSQKPFKALKLEITPTLSKLYFLDSRFEMDHAIQYLEGSDEVQDEVVNNDLDLSKEDELPAKDKGLFE